MLNIEKRKKHITLLLCLVAVLVIGVGGVVAYIVTNTGAINNIFNSSEVTCQVEEKTTGNIKSEVKIKNTGNIAAYIRAEVIITWKDKDGNVLSTVPVEGDNGDYTIVYNTSGKWLLGSDGYYYYKQPVAVGGSTEVLIESCKSNAKCDQEGYFLNVEIIASAIQADGKTEGGVEAVVDAWVEE